MAKNQQSRLCCICKNFTCHNTFEICERPEDAVGTCKVTGEMVYGDDEFADNCESFKAGKRQVSKRSW